MLRKWYVIHGAFLCFGAEGILRLSGKWDVRAILLSFITLRVGRSKTAAWSEAGWTINL